MFVVNLISHEHNILSVKVPDSANIFKALQTDNNNIRIYDTLG